MFISYLTTIARPNQASKPRTSSFATCQTLQTRKPLLSNDDRILATTLNLALFKSRRQTKILSYNEIWTKRKPYLCNDF